MADPILELSVEARLNTIYLLWHFFLLLNKKLTFFQLCLKTAASLFPFVCATFLIVTSYKNLGRTDSGSPVDPKTSNTNKVDFSKMHILPV
jgi:hypothetical protein